MIILDSGLLFWATLYTDKELLAPESVKLVVLS